MKRIVASGMMVLLAAILTYSIATMFAARNSAARIAASRPFCIQVATRNGYRELSSVTQLAGLLMKGRSALNHAVLVIGDLNQPRLLHWSYRADSFVEGAHGPPPLYCRPRNNYFSSLEQSAERDDKMIFIAYGGQEFLIPRSYRPRLTWPSLQILITAKVPGFEPTDGRNFQGNLATMVSIYLKSNGMLESWRYRTNDYVRVEPLGRAYGLTKERVWRRDGANRIFSTTGYVQMERSRL